MSPAPAPAGTQAPTVSVIIAAYASERWEYLRDAVASAAAQTRPALETVVVIDHNPELLARASRELPGVVVIPNSGARGASGARNAGVARSRGEVVAFLDDDARASADWLAALLRHFTNPAVIGAGGRVDPLWATARPAWFPGEFFWAIGASYTGMPLAATPVRNVWSGNMAIRRTAFDAAGGFREEYGKVGAFSRPEDTDLCLRAPGGIWVYEPSGAVGHWVPAQRARLRYFLRRCYYEGRGKAELAAFDGRTATSVERSYARQVLPRAAWRGLREAARGDLAGALRSAAIVAGLGTTAIGFAYGAVSRGGAGSAPAANRNHKALTATTARGAARLPRRSPVGGTRGGEALPYRGVQGGRPPAGNTAVYITEVEMSEPVAGIAVNPRYRSAMVLGRWRSEPVAVVDVPLADGTATAGQVSAALWREAGPLVAARREAADYADGRAAALRDAPAASVIICTRDRAARLPRCLDAVLGQEYPRFEVIVVDNAPVSDAVADLVARRRAAGTGGVPLRHIVEPRPGLSWARNAGLYAATGRIVAYLDDDEHPDRYWLAELARGFQAAPRVAGVSGLVLPAELDTPAQLLYEEFGGHSKGRGLTAEVFDTASHARQHPLYPLPAFGVGASMAFDRAALLRAGGFDVALGAGTPARAGEDTAAITDLMLAGGTFVYWPGAVMWHEHRREVAEVARQLNGYGSGLTAFYTRALLRHPVGTLAVLSRLAPRALRDLRGRDSVRTATMGTDYPASLRRASVRGMLAGPLRYLRGRQLAARIKGGLT